MADFEKDQQLSGAEYSALVPRAVRRETGGGSNGIDRVHAVYEHLHFDIQSALDSAQLLEVGEFIRRVEESGLGRLSWENFQRLDYKAIEREYAQSTYPIESRLSRLLGDRTIFGAPTSHLTAKYSGVPFGSTRAKFDSLYERSVDFISTLGASGYIERELVGYRIKMLPRAPRQVTTGDLECPLPIFNKVSLATVGRAFRTTEIHVTFEHLHLVDPRIVASLFGRGFCSAFKERKATGDYAVIATIQGFEREISHILVDVERWLGKEMSAGRIQCETTIKREDIVAFFVFGEEPGLQEIVEPGSLGET